MRELNNEVFFAKCLLFGEYTILLNGTGLSVPLNTYSGQWKFDVKSNQSNTILKAMIDYFNHTSKLDFKVTKFVEDLNNGLYFDSDIPQGYGVGSSAALSTALYKRYVDQDKVVDVRADLADIESFFHGQSSGLDPLVSYYNQNVFLNNNILDLVDGDFLNKHFFLLDTGKERRTKDLIDYFKSEYDNSFQFRNKMEELSYLNDVCIAKYLESDLSLIDELKIISKIQFEFMNRMIPFKEKVSWKSSLENMDETYKLNGAGGGGFLMVFKLDGDNENEKLISII